MSCPTCERKDGPPYSCRQGARLRRRSDMTHANDLFRLQYHVTSSKKAVDYNPACFDCTTPQERADAALLREEASQDPDTSSASRAWSTRRRRPRRRNRRSIDALDRRVTRITPSASGNSPRRSAPGPRPAPSACCLSSARPRSRGTRRPWCARSPSSSRRTRVARSPGSSAR